MSTDQDGQPTVYHTTDHDLVRSIVEARDGYPAHAGQSEGQGDGGLLQIAFRDRDQDAKEISWETFFEAFDEKDLAAIYTEDGSDVGDNQPVVLRKRGAVDE
jgi:hypothetical protein